jgi:hypothetical protein
VIFVITRRFPAGTTKFPYKSQRLEAQPGAVAPTKKSSLNGFRAGSSTFSINAAFTWAKRGFA